MMSKTPMTTKGSILPTRSTEGEMGVTSTCSRVPISRSRARPMAVTMVVTMTSNIAITPGIM